MDISISTNNAIKTGISSGCLQVSTLMWLRTVNNYQYRYGTNLKDTFTSLYSNGGVLRFYIGYFPALYVASVCKFAELNAYYFTKDFNSYDKLLTISAISSLSKLSVVPIDALDIILQVEGKSGLKLLSEKIKKNGYRVLYYGSTPWITSNFIGTFSWYFVHNTLDTKFKDKFNDTNLQFNLKNGLIGLSASMTSDILTNPLRILKINKQSSIDNIGYLDTIKQIKNEKGIQEFFMRGLNTRILIHGVQNIFFVIVWKNLEKLFNIN